MSHVEICLKGIRIFSLFNALDLGRIFTPFELLHINTVGIFAGVIMLSRAESCGFLAGLEVLFGIKIAVMRVFWEDLVVLFFSTVFEEE